MFFSIPLHDTEMAFCSYTSHSGFILDEIDLWGMKFKLKTNFVLE